MTANPFSNNWAYLKVELQWLERVLMLAVARRKQDDKMLKPLSKSAADQATSHWWKGVIAIDSKRAYDDRPAKAAMIESSQAADTAGDQGNTKSGDQSGNKSGDKSKAKTNQSNNYHEQLAQRIQASHSQGIILGLPFLQEQLGLSRFEKNAVLLAIAPEINRRYARLYRFLDGEPVEAGSDLPTLDLALRLLCRNDEEWREGRAHITPQSPLFQHNVLAPLGFTADSTLLSQRLKLNPDWINPLLMDQPPPELITQLLRQGQEPIAGVAIAPMVMPPAPITLAQLVLPASVRQAVQALIAAQSAAGTQPRSGQLVLLVGAPGAGKLTLAAAIAQALNQTVQQLDLATIPPAQRAALWHQPELQQAPVLLINTASHWLGRQAAPSWDLAAVQAWLQQRQATGHLTLLATHGLEAVRPRWRSRFDGVITLPLPDVAQRQQLWHCDLAPELWPQSDIDQSHLIANFVAPAGEIRTIAQQVSAQLTIADPLTDSLLANPLLTDTPVSRPSRTSRPLTRSLLQAVISQRGHHFTVRSR